MNVNFYIDSIVLDGIDHDVSQRELLRQAVANELTTLFAREGLANSHRNASEVGCISGGTIRHGATGTTSIGQQLAHRIYQGFQSAIGTSARDVGGPT